ncbi:hypothetical protein IC229_31875 [Spirosoma sp. BT702]|uniref:Uncharacterized protein n=1 Tax=Spirosoma profusum TaxID=2771354 RepID=A0A927AVL8_9BACT|nr:hypothetical protein [Spirosoma profusum]MBD2705260.1 hypothetical protein [Spirosoma profusum]
MEVTIYGNNSSLVKQLLIIYTIELTCESHTEIFRQALNYMPRYQPGDVLQFKTGKLSKERYVVDRVLNDIIASSKVRRDKPIPAFENEIHVILRPETRQSE